MTTNNYDVFISASSADARITSEIISALTAADFSVVAPSAPDSRSSKSTNIDALLHSSAMVYVASRNSNVLRRSADEILHAAGHGTSIFVVVTDDSAFPGGVPRPTIYQFPTIDFRRSTPEDEKLAKLVEVVSNKLRHGDIYTAAQRRELREIGNVSRDARQALDLSDACSATLLYQQVIDRLEALPCYPPTLLAHAYSDLAEAHFKCKNFKQMFEADEKALGLLATEDFAAAREINLRLAAAVAQLENPTKHQLTEALSHIEAAIYDQRTLPDNPAAINELIEVKRRLTERLTI